VADDLTSPNWPPSAKVLRWKAVGLVQWMLPRPTGYISSVGFGMRKLRLAQELAEYDFQRRTQLGGPATLQELSCLGMLLIAEADGMFPPNMPWPEDTMFVTPELFARWMARVERRLSEAAR
jgi:hypothetical protein